MDGFVSFNQILLISVKVIVETPLAKNAENKLLQQWSINMLMCQHDELQGGSDHRGQLTIINVLYW